MAGKKKKITLSATVDGEKRKWELTPEEFDRFMLYFEENEIVDLSMYNLKTMELKKVEPPAKVQVM